MRPIVSKSPWRCNLTYMYRLKPILETASRIHSAKGGVRASQARDDDAAAFMDVAWTPGAILR